MIRLILKIIGVVLFFLFICVSGSENRYESNVRSGALKMLGISVICLWWGFRMFSRTGLILTLIAHFFALAMMGNGMERDYNPRSFSEYLEEREANEKFRRELEEDEERRSLRWDLEQDRKNDFYY